MRHIGGLLALTIGTLGATSVATAAGEVVAVFELENQGASLGAPYLVRLTDYVGSELAKAGFKVVPPHDLKRALSRQKAESYKACYQESCQIEVGKELAAEKSLAGTVSKIGSRCVVALKLFDLRSATQDAAGTAKGKCDEDGVLDSTDAALRQLTGRSQGAVAVLPPKGTVPSPKGGGELDDHRIESDMVEVPAGEFFMGCNDRVDSECEANERPGRTVSVAAFAIDRTEVTVAAFQKCVAAGGCDRSSFLPRSSSNPSCNFGDATRAAHPMNCVNRAGAVAFCRWAEKRLPSDQEWEKAARGTDGRKYPWGNDGYGRRQVANIADEALKRKSPKTPITVGYDDGHEETAPVARFPAGASPYGAVDMIGNVQEWVSDAFRGVEYGSIRGASWLSGSWFARASRRAGYRSSAHSHTTGFRCAVSRE